MRFAIICFMSLLLVPALGSEQQRRPSSPPPYQIQGHPPSYRENPPPYLPHPPPPPEHRAPPRHGDIVRYQGPNGPHAGIALGTRPDRQGHYRLAPFLPLGQHPEGQLSVYKDRVVKAHPGDIVTHRDKSMPHAASLLTEGHAHSEPKVTYASGPVHGSLNYVAEHGGNHRSSGRR